MLRRITDVANINYWMRCQGDTMSKATGERFDEDLRGALEDTLGGSIPEHSWWQGSLAVRVGGIGLRSASATSPLAFLSSRASARPMVEDLFRRMECNGLGRMVDYMRQYDDRTMKCITDHAEFWGEELTGLISEELRDGEYAAYCKWRKDIYDDDLEEDKSPPIETEDRESLRNMGTVGAGIVMDAGQEDP